MSEHISVPETEASSPQLVPFGQGKARGFDARQLGTHGARIDELVSLGLPTVAGLTVPSADSESLTSSDTAASAVELLTQLAKRQVASGERPMLIRLTASAPVATAGLPADLPGIGLSPATIDIAAHAVGRDRMLHDVWAGTLRAIGEHALDTPGDVLDDVLLDISDPAERVAGLLGAIAKEGSAPFPDEPAQQLALAATTLLARWRSRRAQRARRAQQLPPDLPLALHVQALVLGPWQWSGYGEAASRDTVTGRFAPWGSFYRGVPRTASQRPDAESLTAMPAGNDLLEQALRTLESHFAAPAGVEFELRDGQLALLSAYVDEKATARVSTCLAVDLVRGGARDERTAVRQVRAHEVQELLHSQLKLTGSEAQLARGLPASPGAASGTAVFSSERALRRAEAGEAVVLVAAETTPADVPALLAAQAVLTSNGGLASHAAVVARGAGRPAVCGAAELTIDAGAATARTEEHTVREGDTLSIDGHAGTVYLGRLEVCTADPPRELRTVLGWADSLRHLGIRANADTGHDARTAVELGAEGIGLCRTEHQFLGDRLPLIRRVILARDEQTESDALSALTEAQHEDFRDLLRGIGSRPVTIRLLDAPMHEFLPAPGHAEDETTEAMAEALREANPMLGVRGVRLALLRERLYPAQVEALFTAWADVTADGVRPELEVMIPLVSLPEELATAAEQVRQTAAAVAARTGVDVPFRIGSMVETPRAALLADKLAGTADFLSFGTNDLTQLTYGFSRDDVERRVLDPYLTGGLLEASPFARLDQDGVGALVEIAVHKARSVRPDIKLGLCGEHGGDPDSIELCHRLGLDYVSCSPGRVPVARLAAGQAATAADEVSG